LTKEKTPPIEGGTMSTTLPDPTAPLLDIPPAQVAPLPPVDQPAIDERIAEQGTPS
jgi:hypothetical protein